MPTQNHPLLAPASPAPYRAVKGAEGEPDRWRIVAAKDLAWIIATIENGQPGGTLDTEEATARLFAAAPELLAAARRALAVLKATGESVRPHNALGALEAAITKATARQ